MSELGLRQMTWPVLKFMTISGQMLPSKLKVMNIFLLIATTGSLITLTILASIELLISASTKLGSALEIITILLTFIEMCFRVIYLSKKQSKILKLITFSHYFPVSCASFIYSERKMRSRAMYLSRRIQLLLCGYVFMILTGYLSLPFLPTVPDFGKTSDITASIINPNRKRPLYLPAWLPFINLKDLSSPAYEIFVCWQAWSFVILVCVFCAADCLLYTFIIFIVEGFKHLKRVVPNKNAGRKHREIMLNGYFPDSLINWRLNLENERNNNQTNLEYKIWVQQHQFLLSLGQELENLFSPIIFGTFLTNGIVLCVLAFVLVKLRNIVGILCVTGHFSCIVFKLYIMARYGQQLRDQSISIGPESISKIWPRMGNKRRIDARIIGLRSGVPLTLTGLGFFILGVEFFGRVCSIALSYFIVLLQIHV